MWIEFFAGFTPHVRLSEAPSADDFMHVERELGVSLPSDLTGVLSETNGASFGLVAPGEDCLSYHCLVWSTDEILEENVRLRKIAGENPSFCEPCEDLLFFASTPNGDAAGFRISERQASGPAVVTMSHEDNSRRELTGSLVNYFSGLLEVAAQMK